MKITDKAFIALKQREAHLEKPRPTDLKNKGAESIDVAAEQLEGQFVSMMIKAMEKTIPKESGSGNNLASFMFSSVMGDEISRQGGLGLGEFLLRHMQNADLEQLKNLPNQVQPEQLYKFGNWSADDE